MPNWKKVITSGSDAALSSLYATSITASYISASEFTGSLYGTASWAYNAQTASSADTFLIRNGLTETGSINITGSTTQIGNVTLTGSLYIQSGSIEMNAPTASISGVDYIDFDTQYIVGTNEPPWKEGRLFYDSGSGALAFYNWEQEVTLNIGQEQWVRARNDSSQVIPNGTPVKITGATGDKPNINLAQAVDQVGLFNTTNDIIGLTTQEFGIGDIGFVTTFGLVNGLDTSMFNAGDILWVSQSAGELTNVVPQAPYDKIFVGIVTRKNPNNGSIFVRCEPPIHFHDISSVSASAYTQGDLWMFNASGSSGIWTNTKTLSGSYTVSGSLNAPTITGSLHGTASWAMTSSQLDYTGTVTGSLAEGSNTSGLLSFNSASAWALHADYVLRYSCDIDSTFYLLATRTGTLKVVLPYDYNLGYDTTPIPSLEDDSTEYRARIIEDNLNTPDSVSINGENIYFVSACNSSGDVTIELYCDSILSTYNNNVSNAQVSYTINYRLLKI